MSQYDDADARQARAIVAHSALIVAAIAFGAWQDSIAAGIWLAALALWFRWGS